MTTSSNQSSDSAWGFPKGRVAKTLRQILDHELTDRDVEAMAVVLFSHLLVESCLNRVVYHIIGHDLPRMGYGIKEEDKETVDKQNADLEEDVRKMVCSMRFQTKLDLIKPSLKMWYPDMYSHITEINKVRNAIVHAKESKNVKFRRLSIWSEEGIEQ